MVEVLFLLLPIAASYGWYMGRRSMRHQQNNKQRSRDRNYFTGLNFILSNESDKAVDLFINMLDVDDDTIDTHLSLGALFRTRGQVDRAIRIHQSLVSRPNLPSEQLEISMMELGKDYMAAGFYDRAEEMFVSLIELSDETDEAESQLILIYQTTREWQKAINIIKNMNRVSRKEFASSHAHYYCQLSDESSTTEQKVKFLKLALKQDEKCGRALVQLIEIYFKNNQNKECKQSLLQLILTDPDLISEVLEYAREVYLREQDFDGYKEFLQQSLDKGAGVSITVALVKLFLDINHVEDAQTILLAAMQRHPTMKGFHQLMQLHVEQAESGKAKDSLTMLEKLVQQQIKHRPSYRCQECGFPSHALYWHCPSCKNWGKVKRIRGLDGE
ncbi:lipopolysaccharide assembly protein LapB [Parashewanella spongiae]|uniref:Lipopolysaccharide assembly protein B n=1 Tax=Parashewanella spongiae TaxID=342950 RepID=A0A3A6TYA1_9GAMM|nr:lipopolysaccharide assembly protein LapB [Parashewanella spongiae]MCL1077728.1 lipopolysaccharide assembly protein LapB [Parashewanella spongiae]RJY18070.1 lipopolysaccharide assembly protein LapB [Parashewanella spongiae]